MSTVGTPRGFDARRCLTDATAGVVLASVLLVLTGLSAPLFWVTDAHLRELLSYLLVWLPLLGAVAAAWRWHGFALALALALKLRPLDLVWGLSIGLLARLVATSAEALGYGHISSGTVTFGETVYDAWWIFGTALAPVLIAPVIEEIFFRGLLLRSLLGSIRASNGGARTSVVISIVVSALTFALVHTLTASTVTGALVVGISTFVFGILAALLTVETGRLGGAIIAHMTFNAIVIVPALLTT
ncbi:CPBP family intramembrane metalloprotease [Cryobacterium sp. CG_9.6]|uniref:CPBP family intramembrane glutamic endopeptidase n=1 Tax=Cryobacterium sp. CG_9.6 TaxID=2760710 RepID=UPI0024730011|nr:CPBP family intramembrane metalloprotease [Cryobacterium sp. CG_9.6]MDH6235794.1 membrane protease YdiL (CAAX protease family) [Cryobacterium sp. CG_9.6]